MSSPTAVEHLVHALREAGVARVHGVEGDSSHPIAAAIRRTDGIERAAAQCSVSWTRRDPRTNFWRTV
jgi:glyoxylate carboligase